VGGSGVAMTKTFRWRYEGKSPNRYINALEQTSAAFGRVLWTDVALDAGVVVRSSSLSGASQ
jgi:hypothetical protein